MLMKWHTSCEHEFKWAEWSWGDDSEWMATACRIEVKFVATITSFSSTFSKISPMVSHLGHSFSSCVKNDATLNHKTSLNFTLLLHLVAISAGLDSVRT